MAAPNPADIEERMQALRDEFRTATPTRQHDIRVSYKALHREAMATRRMALEQKAGTDGSSESTPS